MSEEDIILWQDILDEVAAGRLANLRCPFCKTGEIRVERIEHKTRLECPSCRRFIEGALRE